MKLTLEYQLLFTIILYYVENRSRPAVHDMDHFLVVLHFPSATLFAILSNYITEEK